MQIQQHSIVSLSPARGTESSCRRFILGRISPTELPLNREVVKVIFQVIEKPLVDLFVSAENKPPPTFCSRLYHPQAFEQDAFRLNWTNLHAYTYPPICLIRRVLAKMETKSCTLLLIAHLWPNQHWFKCLVTLLAAPPQPCCHRGNICFIRRGFGFHSGKTSLWLSGCCQMLLHAEETFWTGCHTGGQLPKIEHVSSIRF